MNNKKIIFSILLIIICFVIFAFLTIKPNTEKNDIEKISEYLQNKYSEQFNNIEFLSTIQNEEILSCDGSVFSRNKVKDSYKYYYKAYSKLNDIEFYVYIDKTKKNNKYTETIEDTYFGYLTRRNAADKILTEVNKIFDNLVEYSYAIKNVSKKSNDETKSINIKEELSKVSKQEEEYTHTTYYTKNSAVETAAIYFKVNLSFKEISEDRHTDLLTLNHFIKNTQKDFAIISNYNAKSIEIHIETLDGYKFVIAGDYKIDNQPYIKYYEPQKEYDWKTIDL